MCRKTRFTQGRVCLTSQFCEPVPVADLVDVVERHSGLASHDQRLRAVHLTKRLGRVVSPLTLTPRLPLEGRFLYAGLADRLVHPRHQVTRLWEHWGRPEITWYPGGHTGFFRSRPVQDFVARALVQSGLVESPPLGEVPRNPRN